MDGYIDMHCHLLPGVDDGAQNMNDALALVDMAYRDGTRALLLTPHYRGRFKANSPEKIRETFDIFRQIAKEKFPELELHLGSEVHWESELPEALEAGTALTLCDSRYCLLEFSPTTRTSQILTGVSEVIRYGFTPIIAHAERYEALRQSKSLLEDVLYMGALIQLNADSILGRHGFGIRRFCLRLLKREQAHFIGSDGHDAGSRPPLLGKCGQFIAKKYGSQYATALFCHNPRAVIENTLL